MLELHCTNYSEISKNQLFAILNLRISVFVVEQNCPYQEIDQSDLIANHVFGKVDDHIMAVGRFYKKNNTVFIGRIAIEKRYRNNGYARELMIFILNNIKKEFPNLEVVLSAQEYLINFYHSLGFKKQGNIYLEDGIPHLKMIYFN
jgi:ElaA protein|tara:strand:+ start:1284 stop:1721 length:438 start_codon:yes stop_codon:yes gene_type:complete